MRKLSWLCAALFLLHIGASAPQNSAETQKAPASVKTSSSKTTFSAAASPQAFGDQIAQFFSNKSGQGKTGKELMAAKAEKLASKEKSSPVAKPVAVPPTSVKPLSSGASATRAGAVPPPPTPRASVPKIRQDIQRILDLNKKIKNVQSGSSVQFQRVQEQARIHQKILNELEVTQKQASSQKIPTKSALLAQEKLRIIHEETQRNSQMMEGLGEAPSTVSKDAVKAKTSAS